MSHLGIVRAHLAANETYDRPGSEKQGGSGKGNSYPQRKNMENNAKEIKRVSRVKRHL